MKHKVEMRVKIFSRGVLLSEIKFTIELRQNSQYRELI